MKRLILILLISAFTLPSVAQTSPKVGLVLSGGGAKGFAHIGLLRLIDSLHIKVDYITGTSMGSVIGGLYAVGYSADSIKNIVLSQNWSMIVSNRVELNGISPDVKEEYGRYIYEMPVDRRGSRLASALVEGQFMSNMLNYFLYPVRDVSSFDSLPIPIHCISTDLLTGEKCVLREGSLPLAIRASLAIPSVFSPVYFEGRLMVDGGVVRNFPVQEVKEMGAQIIIGGHTGFRTFNEEEIRKPVNQVIQSFAFNAISDFNEQRKMVDLLVDFNDVLGKYTAGDFPAYREIIRLGEVEARKHLPELMAIAAAQRSDTLPTVVAPHSARRVSVPITAVKILSEKGEPLSEDLKEVVRLRLGIILGEEYTAGELNQTMNRIYSSLFFAKVTYEFEHNASGLTLVVKVKENTPGSLKFAIHYDTKESAGIILASEFRNFLVPQSRVVAAVDLSDRVKVRGVFHKYLGHQLSWWLRFTSELENYKVADAYLYVANNSTLCERGISQSLAIGKNLGLCNAISLSGGYERMLINRDEKFISFISGPNRLYRGDYWTAAFTFDRNKFNRKYFPTKGASLKVEVRGFFDNSMKARFGDTAEDQYLKGILTPSSGFSYPNQYQALADYSYLIPIHRRVTLCGNVYLGISSSGDSFLGSSSYLYPYAKFYVGGVETRSKANFVKAIGLQSGEFSAENVAVASLDLRYNFYRKFYFVPSASYCADSPKPLTIFKDALKVRDSFISYGASFMVDSFLGPVTLSVFKKKGAESWQSYFSFGYKF
ncbi:patatin-like phospholipase family protein [uncultured Acetobacteroides sp.]|uniref:patatin-like phospholipase family protein n=1 Tax=uncultured Acetobacteroides sp. TaxID=1760811 RepID=UPI0029F4C4D7|nr:patatin-like phospholipase family protein [uncultured Acetobacteroides sp.]